MELTMRKLWVIFLSALSTLTSIVIIGCGTGGVSSDAPSMAPTVKTNMPVKLIFISQPGGAAAGSALSAQPVVAFQDASGNTVNGSNSPITLTLTSGTGTSGANLYGPSTMNAANGVAKFQALFVDKAAQDYTLTATAGTLTPASSSPFTISSGPPFKLVFTKQPSDGIAGKPLTPPEITVEDHYGNTVTNYAGSVTMALTLGNPSNAVLSGKTTVDVVDNVARFTDLILNFSYPGYTLTAMSGSLVTANSASFAISAGDRVKLEFTAQPDGAKVGNEFDNRPVVALKDSYGNVATGANNSISISITPHTGVEGAVLSGTTTLSAENAVMGLVVFSDISIDRAGSGYTLTAVSANLTPVVSQVFNVAP